MLYAHLAAEASNSYCSLTQLLKAVIVTATYICCRFTHNLKTVVATATYICGTESCCSLTQLLQSQTAAAGYSCCSLTQLLNATAAEASHSCCILRPLLQEIAASLFSGTRKVQAVVLQNQPTGACCTTVLYNCIDVILTWTNCTTVLCYCTKPLDCCITVVDQLYYHIALWFQYKVSCYYS